MIDKFYIVDRLLNIEGENLENVVSGRDITYWYNNHMDYINYNLDLSNKEDLVIVGYTYKINYCIKNGKCGDRYLSSFRQTYRSIIWHGY